jgi:molybdate-binding protein
VEHVQNVSGHGSSDCGMELEALAKRHGVDVAPIKREAAAQAREKTAAKKATKKPAKKKAGRKS